MFFNIFLSFKQFFVPVLRCTAEQDPTVGNEEYFLKFYIFLIVVYQKVSKLFFTTVRKSWGFSIFINSFKFFCFGSAKVHC
jgi:hypothetical protein